jgi:hypothetical protein
VTGFLGCYIMSAGKQLPVIQRVIVSLEERWLRHCATSRKVAGSIPDGVIGVFH